ncbi:MAG: hypothetical protein KF845_03320 [Cyclobacteriaceae bacterium]|nr:hypothetical protein [Cyclobacteriaceae bacterium]
MKKKIIITICLLFSFTSYGQSTLSVSAPAIWSNVKVKNNWTPPTAPNYKEYLRGSAFGYGVSLNYSFQPKFIIKDKDLLINVGIGYFKQRFDIRRPFDYSSPLEPVFYTDYYSYHCLQGVIGVTYNYPIGVNYSLSGNLSYSWLRSFQQDYTPTSNHGYGHLTQTNHNQIDFGRILILSIGINRNLGDRFSLGLNLLTPVYTRWRNDRIFRDNPSTFYHPSFSIGASISATYHFKKKRQL